MPFPFFIHVVKTKLLLFVLARESATFIMLSSNIKPDAHEEASLFDLFIEHENIRIFFFPC